MIHQVQTIKETIKKKVAKIANCKMFENFKKSSNGGHLKNFREFHEEILTFQSDNISFLVNEYEDMCPLLMKVEELLVRSRSKNHKRLESYFSYWENEVYEAVIHLMKINLDDLLVIMESTSPLFRY